MLDLEEAELSEDFPDECPPLLFLEFFKCLELEDESTSGLILYEFPDFLEEDILSSLAAPLGLLPDFSGELPGESTFVAEELGRNGGIILMFLVVFYKQ